MTNPKALKVSGSSMVPFVLPDSTLVVKQAVIDQLCEGDIICFIDEEGFGAAHRIVNIDRTSGTPRILVRGDAHTSVKEIPLESIIYRAERVSRGIINYRCDSLTGRGLARIAKSNRLSAKTVRLLLATLWDGACAITAVIRNSHPRR